MASPLQQIYFDQLISRVRADKFPSHQLLDRIEASFWTSDQIAEYVAALLQKLDESRYPSHQILDRIERMLLITSAAA